MERIPFFLRLRVNVLKNQNLGAPRDSKPYRVFEETGDDARAAFERRLLRLRGWGRGRGLGVQARPPSRRDSWRSGPAAASGRRESDNRAGSGRQENQ